MYSFNALSTSNDKAPFVKPCLNNTRFLNPEIVTLRIAFCLGSGVYFYNCNLDRICYYAHELSNYELNTDVRKYKKRCYYSC